MFLFFSYLTSGNREKSIGIQQKTRGIFPRLSSPAGLRGNGALHGLSFISPLIQNFPYGNLYLCQCPSRAFFHFYLLSPLFFPNVLLCVNALHGLSFISTPPSENPHKQRLPEPVSAGNSQNILKAIVFHPFLWLFIICSYFSYRNALLFIHNNISILPRQLHFSHHQNQARHPRYHFFVCNDMYMKLRNRLTSTLSAKSVDF